MSSLDQLVDFSGLNVGNVAGIIALCVFIVKFLCPLAIVFLAGAVLGDSSTAATWNVAGRLVQSSYWTTILRTDSGSRANSTRSITFFSWLLPLTSFLLAVAGTSQR